MTRWNEEDSTGNGTFLLGALAGALVGAGVALLMAPKSGAQTREDLSAGYGSVRDAAARRYRDLADRANAKLGELEQKVDQYSSGRPSSTSGTSADTSSTAGYPRA
jgi:gas vesicle protein